jgi:hypothetical protein
MDHSKLIADLAPSAKLLILRDVSHVTSFQAPTITQALFLSLLPVSKSPNGGFGEGFSMRARVHGFGAG